MGVFGGSGPAFDLVQAKDYAKNIGNWYDKNTNGTLAGFTGAGGGLQYTLGGADNDEGYASLNMGKAFVLGTGNMRNGFIDAVIRATEAATDNMNWFLGLSTGLQTADGVFSDTADTLATQDAFGFYKVDNSGEMKFRTCAISTSTAQAGAVSTTTYASATDYRLRMFWECRSSGLYVSYAVNGAVIKEVTDFSYTGVDEMYAGFAVKATGANAEVFAVKSFVAYQGAI